MHKCTHKQTGSQQPLALADTLAISTVSLFWLHAFHSKRRIIYIICVFPKWCEQGALTVGFLLANVSNWPWGKKKNHPQSKSVASIMGLWLFFFSFFLRGSIHSALMHGCLSWHMSTDDASRTAFIRININMCLCLADHIRAPWYRVSEGGHYRPVPTVGKPGER